MVMYLCNLSYYGINRFNNCKRTHATTYIRLCQTIIIVLAIGISLTNCSWIVDKYFKISKLNLHDIAFNLYRHLPFLLMHRKKCEVTMSI